MVMCAPPTGWPWVSMTRPETAIGAVVSSAGGGCAAAGRAVTNTRNPHAHAARLHARLNTQRACTSPFSRLFGECVGVYSRPRRAPATLRWLSVTEPPIKILFVEDDDRLAELTSRYLRGSGMVIERAVSGPEALANTVRRQYDAILLDLML